MSHTIETRFARDPLAAAIAHQEDRLGCLLCTNSRADHRDAYCLPARNIVSTVAIYEHKPAETMLDEVLHQTQ